MAYKRIVGNLMHHKDASVRIALVDACNGYNVDLCYNLLNRMAEDADDEVRRHVASVCAREFVRSNKKSVCRAILIKMSNDKYKNVRMTVAASGANSHAFINDKISDVRAAAARACDYSDPDDNAALMQFLHDPDMSVRMAVADACKDITDPMCCIILDELIKDKKASVRQAVANTGYKAEVLSKDPDPNVNKIAKLFTYVKYPKEANA